MPQNYNFDFGSAIKAGYTPDQINQFLAQQQKQGNSYQLTNTPQATPQQSQQPAQPKSNFFADALPTVGSVLGGIGGALIPGLGETGLGEVGGSAIGSGLGETAKELIEGKPLNAGSIAGQTGAGLIGGATGLGIGKLAGGVLGKLGETEAINGLNLTRLQQNALKIKNGESVASTLTNHGIAGVNAEGLSSGINKVQNTFDSIAKNTNVPLNQDALLSRGTAAIERLKNSSVPSDQALASQVDEALGNVMDKIASGKVTTLADLNAERQAFDKATKDSQFGSSSWGANRVVGDVLRSTAYDTADASGAVGPNGESLKDVGANLRKLYNISNIADKRVGQGNSAGPLSVSNMLLGGVGALAGAPAGPMGSIAGYAAATGARKVLTSQPVAKVLSNTLTGTGKALTTPLGMGATAGLGAATAGGALGPNPGVNPVSNGDTNNNQQNPQNNQNTLPPSPIVGNNSTIPQATPATQGANPLQGYTLNGQALDPAMANLIYKVATYQLDPTKMTSLKNNERERLVSLASQFDPSYDSSQFPVKQKVREDFATGKSAQNVKAINTAIGHLSELAQTGNELGNGSVPLLNEAKNAFQTGTGSSKANNFETDADAVAGEMSNIFKATGGTDSEIAAWRKHFRSDMSPAQQRGVIQKAVALMAGRLQALQSQYTQGLGKPANYQFLNPSSQAILQNFGIDPSSLTQPGQ